MDEPKVIWFPNQISKIITWTFNSYHHSSLVDYFAQVENRKNEPTLSEGQVMVVHTEFTTQNVFGGLWTSLRYGVYKMSIFQGKAL